MTSPFETASSEAVDDSGVKRDRQGRYLLPPLGGGKEKGWTRATTFAKSISDTYVLNQWGARMAIKGLAMRPDLYALTAATPLDDREKLNGIAEQCKEAAGAKAAASHGTALHAFTEARDRGEEIPSGPWDADVTAYEALVEAAGLEFFPHLIERIVIVERYGVAGTFDRIARLKRDLTVKLPGHKSPIWVRSGSYVVVDLKTGKDLSYGMNEIAIQLALYASADAMWNKQTGQYEELPPYLAPHIALVIHLPVGQAKAELIAVDITKGHAACELCAEVRDWRKVRALSSVVAVGEAVEVTGLGSATPAFAQGAVRPATWEERIGTATSKAELSAIWTEANAANAWTVALSVLAQDQLAKFATA